MKRFRLGEFVTLSFLSFRVSGNNHLNVLAPAVGLCRKKERKFKDVLASFRFRKG